MARDYDAVVVGSGPNGLAAAIELAQEGYSVLVIEARETIGGGIRSAELTLPGFQHDICSAIHPLGVASPFFRGLPLAERGLEWVFPPAAVAHPLDGGTAAVAKQSVAATAASLGPDAPAYGALMEPLVRDWHKLESAVLGPLRPPRHPVALARFGLRATCSARALADRQFRGNSARALWAGLAAHAMLPLEQPITAAFGLILGTLAHAVGWPLSRGGSQSIAAALASYFQSLGGEIVTGRHINSLKELPPARAVLLDITPRQLLQIAGERLPPRYRCRLQRYRYGPGVFKLDLALDSPIPWAAEACAQAGTVHVGGTLEEIAAAEHAVARGIHAEKPFVLVAQQSLFDATRAPQGKHTVWAYCHVPNGSTRDMTGQIETQIERFAPGFRERILAHSTYTALQMEQYNPNYVGGDINGGLQDWRQLYTRPVAQLVPYATPLAGVYLCSSATPPGGGVHGMCGYHAARAALRQVLA